MLEIPVDMTEGEWGEWQLNRAGHFDSPPPDRTPRVRPPRPYTITRTTTIRSGGVDIERPYEVITSYHPDSHWGATYTTQPEEAPTMSNARTSDIDRRHLEEIDEHTAVLERFVRISPDGSAQAPVHVLSIDQLIADKLKSLGWSDSEQSKALAQKAVQKHLKERVVGGMTKLGRVYLDTKGEHQNPNTYWLNGQHASIAFGALTEMDVTIQRQCPPELTRLNAIAMYFDPGCAAPRTMKDSKTGEWITIPNEYSERGYVAICGAYPSLDDAEDAMHQLQRAVTVLADGAKSAREVDPIETTGIEFTAPPPGLEAL